MNLIDLESGARSSLHKKNKPWLYLFLTVISVYLLGRVLAANINLNDNQPIEFGMGVVQTLACDNEVLVTPYSEFVNESDSGSFKFVSVLISQIDLDSCNGKTIELDVYNNESGKINNVADEVGTPVKFAIMNGVFRLLNDLDATIESSKEGPPWVGQITITFTNPKVNADQVDSITIQTLEEDIPLTDFLIHYDFANRQSYPGTGLQVYDLNGNVLAALTDASMFNSGNGGYIEIDGDTKTFGTQTDASPLFIARESGNVQSIVLWVRPKSDGIIFDEQSSPTFSSNGWHDSQIELVSGRFNFRFWNMPPTQSPTDIIYPGGENPLGEWYHIALVYDGENIHIHVDGLETFTTYNRLAPWESGSPTYFGLGTSDSTYMYLGTGAAFDLASVRVYSKALSSSEINNLYTMELPRFN
jgi:hypothetical protein